MPLATVEEVLRLYREMYFDLNMRHFHEKLREEHGIELSYTWVQKALQGAGLVARHKKRGKHRRRRERRPMPGMLLHIDGSKHQWFGDERWYDLIVILDDATSEIYYAQLVEEESTRTVMAALREVIVRQGLFCALYSDRGSHFFVTPKAGEKVDKHRLTQVGRAMKELGVQMIPAYSPQARGRASAVSEPGKGGCRRSCGWPGSRNWKRPTSFYASGISRSSTKVQGGREGERHGIPAHGAQRSGLDLYGTDRTRGGQRQHGGDCGSDVANGKDPVPQFAGRLHGDDPRASGRNDLDSLWTACGGPLQADGNPARCRAES